MTTTCLKSSAEEKLDKEVAEFELFEQQIDELIRSLSGKYGVGSGLLMQLQGEVTSALNTRYVVRERERRKLR